MKILLPVASSPDCHTLNFLVASSFNEKICKNALGTLAISQEMVDYAIFDLKFGWRGVDKVYQSAITSVQVFRKINNLCKQKLCV